MLLLVMIDENRSCNDLCPIKLRKCQITAVAKEGSLGEVIILLSILDVSDREDLASGVRTSH